MSDVKARERLDRALKGFERSERFQSFVNDPDVAAFFAAYEADRIKAMVAAAPTDDQTRKDEALRLHAMREFRLFLGAAIQSGDAALKIIEREKTHG